MSAPTINAAEMLEIQFRKALTRRHVLNATFRPAYSHPAIPTGDAPLVEVINRRGQGVFFTASGFTMPERGFVRYDDVARVVWMGRDRDLRRKREEFDRIELEFADGSSAKLLDLDQAVFPLLKFFDWMIQRRTHEA
jgi:hypothetical protein